MGRTSRLYALRYKVATLGATVKSNWKNQEVWKSDGNVAIDTKHFHATGLVRKILLRMRGWENWLFLPGGERSGGGH